MYDTCLTLITIDISMNHYQHRPNYQRPNQQMGRPQSQQIQMQRPPQQMMNPPQPKQEDFRTLDTIPVFHPEDYLGFKDLILAASVPETHQSSESSTSQLQKIIEEKVALNGEVMDSLLAVANCLQPQTDFLAKPPFLTHDHFVLDRETLDLEVIQNYSELLNQPLNSLMGTL